MNTLSRVDSFFASLGREQDVPNTSTSPSSSSVSTPSYTPPLAASQVSSSSAVNGNSAGSSFLESQVQADDIASGSGTGSTAFSSSISATPRRLSNLPPRRRGRRTRGRRPTGSSIKLPPPTTPLLVRIALALWSILLSFWRSLVGDTRAVRERRRWSKLGASHGGGVGGNASISGLPSSPANGNTPPALPGLSAPSVALSSDVVSATSDEGSASEPDQSDREWVDPVTRAPDVDAPAVDAPSDGEFRARTNSDTIFSFRLRSARSKETVSITGSVDREEELGTTETGTITSSFAPLTRTETPPSILQPRKRLLLPNPMSTSLLDPSVPAVPHRSVTPSIIPNPRPHQTPFHLQKTLILDLDETLIHSTSRPIGSAHSGGGMLDVSGLFGGGRRRRGEGHTVEVVLNGRSTTYHVYKRPYVDFFLKKVASWYTLVIFTASMPEYADPVIDWLDNGRGLFAKRLYRESCFLQPNGSYIKDLADVEPDLSKVCFMDNSPISYSWNKANALPIEGWTSDPNDEALLHSIPVLDSLRFVTDVRHILGIRGFM